MWDKPPPGTDDIAGCLWAAAIVFILIPLALSLVIELATFVF